MCSGRVDLEFVFRALARETDGVFIGGCRLGECNYITHGNYHALNLVALCKQIMKHIGLNPDRLMISFMSSGEGNLFAEAVDKFSEKVASLGPLGSSEGLGQDDIKSRLSAIRKLIPFIKITKNEKLQTRLEEDEYESFYTAGEIETLFNEVDSFQINPDKCKACMICLRRCPVQAISGGKKQVHIINQDQCIRCGTCLQACPERFGAVEKKTSGFVDFMGSRQKGTDAQIIY